MHEEPTKLPEFVLSIAWDRLGGCFKIRWMNVRPCCDGSGASIAEPTHLAELGIKDLEIWENMPESWLPPVWSFCLWSTMVECYEASLPNSVHTTGQ